MGWFAKRAKLKKQKADDAACRDLLARLEGTKSRLAEMAEESAKEFIPIIQNLISEVLEAKPPSEACEMLVLSLGHLSSLIQWCNQNEATLLTNEMTEVIRASGDPEIRKLYSNPEYVTARSEILQSSSKLFLEEMRLKSINQRKSKLAEMLRYGKISQSDSAIQVQMLKHETQEAISLIEALEPRVKNLKALIEKLESEATRDTRLSSPYEGEASVLQELGIDDWSPQNQ